MAFMHLSFSSLSFGYPSQTQLVFDRLNVQFARGWTGIVGANGSGKSTLLLIAAGQLAPSSGQVQSAGRVVYCPQRTEDSPYDLPELLAMPDSLAAELAGRLGLSHDWPGRWNTLSHGERKRAQIACSLWRRPDILAVDEPTNHVDASAGVFLADALARFRGIGLLVSHDRALLDRLCHACLTLEQGVAVMRPGNYSAASAAAARDLQALRHQREVATRQAAALAATAAERRRQADQADAKRSKRHLARGDADGRAMINLARVSGKDGQAGRLSAQIDARLQRARDAAASVVLPRERKLGMELRGEAASRKTLLRLEEQTLAMGDRLLHLPTLQISNTGRIGIRGRNGCGKTTLLRYLLPQLNIEPQRLVYLPQEISAEQTSEVMRQLERLDSEALGSVMAAIACLGSEPRRLLATENPSPGELRKLLLALGLWRRPHMVVMDEPTNHLDLPSIECLEEALAECRCALLLVSHDEALLGRLTRVQWEITCADEVHCELQVRRA